MSKPDIWMPLYIGEYLADTMRLTTVQHGAYLLLLMHYWKSGPLPDDDEELAGIVKLEPRVWGKIAPSVRRFFTLGDDGMLHQKRADAERAKAADISAKRRNAVSQRSDRKATEPDQSGGNSGSPAPSNDIQTSNNSYTNVTRLKVQNGTHARGLPPCTKEEEDSVPSGTDAEVASAVPSPADLLWSVGVPILKRLTSKSDGQCRAMLGKLRRDMQDDCPRLLLILQEAASSQHVDPVAWLTAATGGRKSGESASDRRIREQRETMHRLVYGEDEPVTIDQIPDRSLLQ